MLLNRKYYSSRKGNEPLNLEKLFEAFKNTYLYFKDQDYFKEKLEITSLGVSKKAKYLSSITLNDQIFPIEKWDFQDMQLNEDLIFSSIEFLFDHISKPGEMDNFTTETGFNYNDYSEYDTIAGQNEFRQTVNYFLSNYNTGFVLDENGEILKLGEDALEHIFEAEIIEYDFEKVDLIVQKAIHTWKKRDATLEDKKAAIKELADVFEWLQKTNELNSALNKKDERDLFNIVNNFAVRHHNPNQKTNYDENIWYSWMFHFYLASYHAIIRLIVKNQERSE